jgi:hypothetical protein
MHQLTNKAIRNSRRGQSIESLKAEYHQNRQRIHRLELRNQELAERIRMIQQQPEQSYPRVAPIDGARRSKSLLRRFRELRRSLRSIQWGKYSLEFWLQAAVLALGIALVCGSLSFMVTRLIAALLGG